MNNMKFQVPEIVDIIRDLGYKSKVHDIENCYLIESATSGLRFYLYCWPQTGSEKKLDSDIYLVRFRFGWYELVDFNETEVDALCNWHNANQPFSKMYRRNNENSFDLILEADLYALDGMSSSSLAERFEKFTVHIEYAKNGLIYAPSLVKKKSWNGTIKPLTGCMESLQI